MAADPVVVGVISFIVGAGVTYMATRRRGPSTVDDDGCSTDRCRLRVQCIAAVNDPEIPDYDAWLQGKIADDQAWADACNGVNPIPPSTNKDD